MAIIKYYTNFIDMRNSTYEEVEDPRRLGQRIQKDEAKKRIKELGLVMAYADEDGMIWDTPQRDFYETYKGLGKEIKEL